MFFFYISLSFANAVTGINDVQNTYGLNRISWQGDPCVPKQYSWDGLNCNNSDISIPPIIISL